MKSDRTYLRRVKRAVEKMHECRADHVGTDSVRETFKGQTVWDGSVEVFKLRGHPKTDKCYAWSHREGATEHFTAVLEIPPVTSPQAAVQASIIQHAKQQA